MKNKFIATILLFSTTFSFVSFAQGENEFNIDPDEEPYVEYNSQPSSLTIPPVPAPLKNEPDVGEAISPMKKGQIAPFTGLLLSPAAIASIMADLTMKDDLIRLEVNKAVSELKVKNDYQTSLLKVRSESDLKIKDLRIDEQKREIDRLDEKLKKERESRPDPFLWAGIGLGTGVVLSTLTAAIVIAVNRN